MDTTETRILVCGGREFDDWKFFSDSMWTLMKNLGLDNQDYFEGYNSKKITIIHGDAKGADFCARLWAKLWGCTEERYPANWKIHGYSAGPVRNKRMLEEGKPNLVIAFPGGTGTANMVSIAKKAGVEVIEVS